MARDNNFRVSGAVFNRETKQPLRGYTVGAYDKDFWREQPLGEAVTDESGRYEVMFGRDDFAGPLFKLERNPDIFLLISDSNGNLIRSTRKSVVVNAGIDTRIDVGIEIRRSEPQEPQIVYVGGEPVNPVASEKLTREDLIDAYQVWRRPDFSAKRLDLIKEAFPGLLIKRNEDDDCGEGFGEVIRQFLRERGDFRSIEESDFDDFPGGVTVKSFFTDNIVVKYTTDAGAADLVDATIPGSDLEYKLTDGTSLSFLRANLVDLHADNTEVAPTYVQKVGLLAEYALSQWINAPFSYRDPRDGSARMEYRILKQSAGIAGRTSASWSHVEVHVDNGDSQNSFTVPHELFHQIQYRYNNTTTRSGIYGIIREGGARFAVESINDKPNRYVVSSQDIFDGPDESLTNVTTGVKNPIRYAAGLFWKYIAEKHSSLTGAGNEPGIGVDTYRKVLESTATVSAADPGIGYVVDGLRDARRNMPWYGRFDQFRYYDAAKEELDSHETTWANYLAANYLHSTGNPVSDSAAGYPSRFDYIEDEAEVPFSAAIAKLAALQSDVATSDDLVLGQGDSVSRTASGNNPWAARYYRVRPSSSSPPRLLRVGISASAGMTDPIIQILRLGPGGSLVDIHRSDSAGYTKTINMNGLESVIVIVGSRDNGGDFTLNFDEIASDTDVMVTRWNTKLATEYEVNPAGWSWTWVSPDIMVDTDDDGLADTEVFFDTNNKLKIRLHNRGNLAASNITVDFWYQKATPYLSASSWIPVTNAAGVVQQVTAATLAAQGDASGNDVKWFSVDWAPANDGTDHRHWCVKAKVTAPGDPNADNKLVLSNFSNVLVDDSDSELYQLVRFIEGPIDRKVFEISRGKTWKLIHVAELGDSPPEPTPQPCSPRSCAPYIVAPEPTKLSFMKIEVSLADALEPSDVKGGELTPSESHFYPVDTETLPPGVDPSQLVTIVQTINGEAVGGVTLRVVKKGDVD